MLFFGLLRKKQKNVENKNGVGNVDVINNKSSDVKKKDNNQSKTGDINSKINNLVIVSNINVSVEYTANNSYYELIVDNTAEIEKIDVIENGDTLNINLKVNKKDKKTSNNKINVINSSVNITNSKNNICINSSNVTVNNSTIISGCYRVDGEWKLNVYLNKDELNSLNIKSDCGDIFTQIDTNEVTINTVSGDVICESVIEKAIVKTTSGDIKCTNIIKEANIKSTSGDITASCKGTYEQLNVNVKNVSGDVLIYLTDISKINKKIDTVSGDINFDCDLEGETICNLKVNTVSGDITVE